MSGDGERFTRTAADLRREFDATFAAPEAARTEVFEDLVALRMGVDPYAILLSEIGGLHVDLLPTPVPSPIPELIGIAVIRSRLLPVYDLAALLGYARPVQPPRWTVLTRSSPAVGLAFHTYETYLRVPHAAVVRDGYADDGHGSADSRSSLLRGTVHAAGISRPIVHVAALLTMIERRGRMQQRSLPGEAHP